MSLLDSLLGGYVYAQESGQPQPAPSRRTLVFSGATVVDNGPTANSTTVLISGGGGSFPGGALCSGTGTTVSVGARLSLVSGTLAADNQFTGSSSQLAAGNGSTVTVGSGLSLASGTLTASGGGGATLISCVPSSLFLCHFDGTGSSFTNDGFSQSLSIATIGSVSQTTSNYQFGPASLLCDGNASNGLYVNNSTGAISLGTNAWTWECWVYLNAASSYDGLIAASTSGDYQGPILVLVSGSVYAYASVNGSGGWTYSISTGYTLPIAQWNHVALVADGLGNLSVYANGLRIGTTAVGSVFCANKIWLGHYPYFPDGVHTIDGFIDEARFSNIAQYSGASYTVPTAPFANGTPSFPGGASAGTLGYAPGVLFTCLGSGAWQYSFQTSY